MDVAERTPTLSVLIPRIPESLSGAAVDDTLRDLLDEHLACAGIRDFVAWYYTPMALGFTRHLLPRVTIYDCMDELSGFRGAPPELLQREAELFRRADLVFTGGRSLYESKRSRHDSVYLFPSSVDAAHFGRARVAQPDPPDQANIPRPRLGFLGVLDERLDTNLIAAVADLKPDWQFVLVGPTVKIDPDCLPRRSNIHYLGSKVYAELPEYLAGWDAALIPFAHNEATRFISPTKTPEYLAAGCPVVSTRIRDVVEPYATAGLVRVADEPVAFAHAIEEALAEKADVRRARCDDYLRTMSWDSTWAAMEALVRSACQGSLRGVRERAPVAA